MATSKAQRRVLLGLQGASDTAVPVDIALRATCTLKPKVTKIHPEEDIGSYAPHRHYVSQVMPEGVIAMDATYEQILFPIAMAFAYIANPGGGAPYTWAWTLQHAAVPATHLWTLEYFDGGTYVVRAIDVIASGLTISGSAPDGWQVEAPIIGGQTDLPDAISADPALDDTVTPIKMAETSLWVDTTWGGIGGTEIANALISFNWKLEDFKHKKQFGGLLYPRTHGYAQWKTTLELVMEVSNAQLQLFADALLATTQYAVRIYGYVDANNSCAIDGMYMVEDVDTLDDRDGNNTIKVTLLGEADASDNVGGITLINDVATL